MHTFRLKLGLTFAMVLFLVSCGASEQISNVQKNAGQAQEAIAKLAASKNSLVNMKDEVSQTLSAVKAKDFAKAQQNFGTVQETWKGLEKGLTAVSADGTKTVQAKLQTVATELKSGSPDAAKLTSGLQALTTSLSGFAIGGANLNLASGVPLSANVLAMKDALEEVTTAVQASDFNTAKNAFSTAKRTWYQSGSSIKGQSPDIYQNLDGAVKTVNTGLSVVNPQQDFLLTHLKTLSDELNKVSTEK